MIAKFILVGRISKISKHEGGVDNKGFYTCTITTQSSYKGKKRDAFHNVSFFSDFIFDKLLGLVNEAYVTVEGKISNRKNESTGYWEPTLNGTAIEPMFDSSIAKKTEEIDDEIGF